MTPDELRAHVERELRTHGVDPTPAIIAACVTACTGPVMCAEQDVEDVQRERDALCADLTRVAAERDEAIAVLRSMGERVRAIAESLHTPSTTKRERA